MNLAGVRRARKAGGADDCVSGGGALMQVRLDGKAVRGAKMPAGTGEAQAAALRYGEPVQRPEPRILPLADRPGTVASRSWCSARMVREATEPGTDPHQE